MGAVRIGPPERLTLWLRDRFGAKTFVETGTFKAGTTVWAAAHFETVVTIEGQEELHAAAAAANADRKNITFLKGDSRTVLPQAVSELTGPAVFWLDAHWSMPGTFGKEAECPLLEELATLNASPHDHTILIDDARFFFVAPAGGHSPEDWPGLTEIVPALNPPGRPRYVAVFEDVIVGVPEAARAELIALLQPPPASLVGRVVHWLRGR